MDESQKYRGVSIGEKGQQKGWATFLVYSSMIFILYALIFVVGYKPLVLISTPGGWDGAPDAGQQIFDNFPLWSFHAACAVLYMGATLLQFKFPGLLKRNVYLHRVSGYVFLSCGTLLAVTGLVMGPRSEYHHFIAPASTLTVLWTACAGMALWTIRTKQVEEHWKWVVRTTAAGYISIIGRPILFVVKYATGLSFRASGAPAVWIAYIVVIPTTEWLIRDGPLAKAPSAGKRILGSVEAQKRE